MVIVAVLKFKDGVIVKEVGDDVQINLEEDYIDFISNNPNGEDWVNSYELNELVSVKMCLCEDAEVNDKFEGIPLYTEINPNEV